MRKIIFRKVVVVMVAIIGALLMVACGANEDSKTVLETETYTEHVTEEVTGDVIAEDTEDVTTEVPEESISDFREMELSAEEVIAIAEKGIQVIKELNPEKMVEFTNIELQYYAVREEEANAEIMLDDITEVVNEMDENYNSLGSAGQYYYMDNIALYDVEPVYEEEIAELNRLMSEDPMSMFEGLEYYPYSVEKAYKVQMSYDRQEENKESYVLVVYANGQWELDILLAVVRDVYQMLMEMK